MTDARASAPMAADLASTAIVAVCEDRDGFSAFLKAVATVIASGQTFQWWIEEDGGALRLGFSIRIDDGVFKIADANGEHAGTFVEFSAAIAEGVRVAG